MFRHACAMGLEGIVSKRVTSRYNFGLVQELAEGQEPGL
jgi:ATP-dependent DNA ligase